jgi:hypothetical protein
MRLAAFTRFLACGSMVLPILCIPFSARSAEKSSTKKESTALPKAKTLTV